MKIDPLNGDQGESADALGQSPREPKGSKSIQAFEMFFGAVKTA